MYSRFQLSFNTFNQTYYDRGLELYNRQQTSSRSSLDRYLSPDGVINGGQMEKDWFPSIDADIFLSHSHQDKRIAICLAGMLAALGLKVFIDSCIWGYAPALAQKINDRFCMNANRSSYIYDQTMRTAGHVHCMLSTALLKMIDKTECSLFLNTPQSISSSATVAETNSPWIYAEIGMTRSVRKAKLAEYRAPLSKGIETRVFNESFDFRYPLDLKHLIPLSNQDLINWVARYSKAIPKPGHPLDSLYDLLAGKTNLNS